MCGKLFKEEDTQNNTEDKNNSFQGKNLIYSLTCCDCCAPTSRKNLVYYHLKAVGYNEMACGMRRSVWKDKHKTPAYFHTVHRLKTIIFQILSKSQEYMFHK